MRSPADGLYWIGGSPCSGKSSIADELSRRYGLACYHCDEHWSRHTELASQYGADTLTRLAGMTWDELWMRAVALQVQDEYDAYREEFPMILDDIVQLRAESGLVVEGASAIPSLVSALAPADGHAVCVVPTESFQRRTYATRQWKDGILAECSDPAQAWENWMARDACFARQIAAEAQALGWPVIWVDGSRSISQHTDDIARWFGLGQSGTDA